MNLLTLFSYQVILLVSLYRSCQSAEIRMDIFELQIWKDNDPSSVIYVRQVLIKASEDQDQYFFADAELAEICGGTFTSENIEIKNAFEFTLTFSIIKADISVTLECVFTTMRDLQLFFNELRKTYGLEGLNSVSIDKVVLRLSDGRMQRQANNSLFYRKPIDKPQINASYSYYLVRQHTRLIEETGATIQTQEADAVFISRKFNITGLVENNAVGICLSFFPIHTLLLLRFADREDASRFIGLVRGDTNPTIHCSIGREWVAQRKRFFDEPEPFDLPHLPYLR